MKNTIKLLFMPILALAIILSCGNFTVSVQASTISNASEIETIAKNAPNYLLRKNKAQWNNVRVIDDIPLYDFNNKLIAYSVDLQSKTNNEKAYVIISKNEDDGPILEFATGKYSLYHNIINSDQTCIYDGVLSYYSTSNSKYYDLKKNVQLKSTDVTRAIQASKHKNYISKMPIKAKAARNILKVNSQNSTASSLSPAESILSDNILNVPDYLWYRGCAPTASAMVLAYDYNSTLLNVSVDTLIDQLANAMGTDSNGSTYTSNVPEGIEVTMAKYGKYITSSNEGQGTSASTFDKYRTEIDNNNPVIVNLYNSTETAPSYPSGFGNHSMAGAGYIITTASNYLVVNDTGCDGWVICDYDSSALGTPCWTYVH